MASSPTLTFIKHNVPSDEQTINRLFVSAYLESNGLRPPQSLFLSKFVISPEEKEHEILQYVLKHIINEFGKKIQLEELVKLFEFVISPADRVINGAVYTPDNVRKIILQRCLSNKDNNLLCKLRIADISCGCGGFLMDVAQFLYLKTRKSYAEIFKENIFGIDIQMYAIERTKILLSLLALSVGEDMDFTFNLLCRDTLDYINKDWDNVYTDFDVIIGNPPYVCSRKLPKETYSKLKKYEVCCSGHPDLYIPFIQIATEMLSDSGCLGYITMNSFLRSLNGRALRKFISKNKFALTILDFRGFQIFKSRNTYTCLFFLDKGEKASRVKYATDEIGCLRNNLQFSCIPYEMLDDIKGWKLNNLNITLTIESTGVQIKDYCPSRHGIATLSNETYIFTPINEDAMYYYIESEDKSFPIEKGICRNVINPNRFNSSKRIEDNYEKLIFPYQICNNKALVISLNDMCKIYPMALKYLNHKKKELLSRDKGNTSSYPQWYAFGRTQSLVLPRYKLFFPKFANQPIRCIISEDQNLMLYNGLAFVNDDIKKLKILKKIIESAMFWQYIKSNGKPYASGYYSLSGVDIKHFGIPLMSVDDENELLSLNDNRETENWLRNRYNIKF